MTLSTRVTGALESAQELAKNMAQPVLYLSWDAAGGATTRSDLLRSAPYLRGRSQLLLTFDTSAIVVCSDELDQTDLYWQALTLCQKSALPGFEHPLHISAVSVSRTGRAELANN